LPVGGVGAAELIQRPSPTSRRLSCIFDRGRDIGRSDVGSAFDIRPAWSGSAGSAAEPIAQHEIGRLRAGRVALPAIAITKAAMQAIAADESA